MIHRFINKNKPVSDYTELYIDSKIGAATVEFKKPLLGISGFELISLELPNTEYNVMESVITTSLGTVTFPSGKYTLTQFTVALQNLLNSVSASQFTVTYSSLTKKITIACTTSFSITLASTWSYTFKIMIGRDISDATTIGPTTNYTFPNIARESTISEYNVVCSLMQNKAFNNISSTPNYVNTIPITQSTDVLVYLKLISEPMIFKEKLQIDSLNISIVEPYGNTAVGYNWSCTLRLYY
jgi:hypothetical protein